jgi:hypothetical protein
MAKTTYNKQEFIIKDIHGAFLKANTNNNEFITDYNKARKFKNKGLAEHVAKNFNDAYIADNVTDVWGQPKRVKVMSMTTTVIIDEV